jgi:predicted acetyltransferase
MQRSSSQIAHGLRLVWPSQQYLSGYVSALQRGWSADTVRGEAAAREELENIANDPSGFIEQLVDREAKGPPVVLLDGSTVPRLPGYRRWLWDGQFCGSIGFRWQPGTTDLPSYCLGHIGFAVVPWKRGKGYATLALKELLPAAQSEGLSFVELTTDPTNVASQRVIQKNGGALVERFLKPAQYGHSEGLRFRIELDVPNSNRTRPLSAAGE